MGLTALLGGCDNGQEKVLDVCDVGGVQVRVVYDLRQLNDNFVYTTNESHYHPTLEFYKDNSFIASVKLDLTPNFLTPNDNWVQCDNGRKLNIRYRD